MPLVYTELLRHGRADLLMGTFTATSGQTHPQLVVYYLLGMGILSYYSYIYTIKQMG